MKDIIEKNRYRIIIKLRPRRVVITLKFDNIFITLQRAKKLLHRMLKYSKKIRDLENVSTPHMN